MPRRKITLVSRIQAPIQAMLRPGQWIPGVKKLRDHAERWSFPDKSAAEAFDLFVQAMEHFKTDEQGLDNQKIQVAKADRAAGHMRVHTFTPGAEWLDVVTVRVTAADTGCEAVVRSFSSGFIPTSVPLAPLLSAAFFWVPFSGNSGEHGWTNTRRVQLIREHIGAQTTINLSDKSVTTWCC